MAVTAVLEYSSAAAAKFPSTRFLMRLGAGAVGAESSWDSARVFVHCLGEETSVG